MELLIGCSEEKELARLSGMAKNLGYYVLGCCKNGYQLIEECSRLQPDAILCDLILPGIDGIEVLRRLNAQALTMNPLPVFRMPFGMGRSLIRTMGVTAAESWEEALLLLPLAAERGLDARVQRLVQAKLCELGVPAHMRGKAYMEQGLLLCLRDGSRLQNLRDLVYAPIAQQKGVSPASVERDVRYAIESAWRYGHLQVLYDNFGYTILPERGKPTNKAFFAQLTEALRRQMRKKEIEETASGI